ncbi:hypothetical protein DASB73_020890 [Starmerella bacillaris]|uniref:Uncharacterized protein n=1 Tax=Starmerella bacillaris TaxID=1247836 RepID=A0AAV5RKI8_STABA|nr:hypothetical protein DASB73_020890 [Starmerella bacillaris]
MFEFNIVLLGNSKAGKTCLVTCYEGRPFQEAYEPTIEDLYTRPTRIDGHYSLLKILDTEGVEQFHDMREVYIRGSDAFILVYDTTDANSLTVLEDLNFQIRELKGKGAAIFLVGTKRDLIHDRSETTKLAAKMASKLHMTHMLASAKNPNSVKEVFDAVTKQLEAIAASAEPKRDSNSISSASVETWLYTPAERKREIKHHQPVLKRSALKLKKSMSKINKSKSMRNIRNVLSSASLKLKTGESKSGPNSPHEQYTEFKDMEMPNTKDVNEVIDLNINHVTQTKLDEKPHIIDVRGKSKEKHGCFIM